MASYGNSYRQTALEDLVLPDRRCIVSVHVYVPNSFCSKSGGESEWDPEGREARTLAQTMEGLRQSLTVRHIPFIITECGLHGQGQRGPQGPVGEVPEGGRRPLRYGDRLVGQRFRQASV